MCRWKAGGFFGYRLRWRVGPDGRLPSIRLPKPSRTVPRRWRAATRRGPNGVPVTEGFALACMVMVDVPRLVSLQELERLVATVGEREGWDFSRVRMVRDPTPWDSEEVVRRYLKRADRVLDMGTVAVGTCPGPAVGRP